MKVIASFKLNKHLERAIAELEHIGIDRTSILALPLTTQAARSMTMSNSKVMFENGPILGAILMLLGTIYGYILAWGPIIWALIGLVSGMVVGIGIDLLRIKRRGPLAADDDSRSTEVFLLVHCLDKEHALYVADRLWKHQPMGVTTFAPPSPQEGGL